MKNPILISLLIVLFAVSTAYSFGNWVRDRTVIYGKDGFGHSPVTIYRTISPAGGTECFTALYNGRVSISCVD